MGLDRFLDLESYDTLPQHLRNPVEGLKHPAKYSNDVENNLREVVGYFHWVMRCFEYHTHSIFDLAWEPEWISVS